MWDIREGVVGADTFIPKHVVIITWKNMSFAGGIDIALYKVRSNINTFHHFCLVLQSGKHRLANHSQRFGLIFYGSVPSTEPTYSFSACKTKNEKEQETKKKFSHFSSCFMILWKRRGIQSETKKKLQKIKHKIERCFWWIANLMSCDFSLVPLKIPPFRRFVFHQQTHTHTHTSYINNVQSRRTFSLWIQLFECCDRSFAIYKYSKLS